MKQLFFLSILLIILHPATLAQSKTIKKAGIKKITEIEIDLESGLSKPIETEFKIYDQSGNLIEWKRVNLKGEFQNWEKYTYNEANELLEELFLNQKGEITGKHITYWSDGFKVKKEYFDHKGRMRKVREYQYEYHPK